MKVLSSFGNSGVRFPFGPYPLVEKSGNTASDPNGASADAPRATSQTARPDLTNVSSPLGVSGKAFLAHCDTEGDAITNDACKIMS